MRSKAAKVIFILSFLPWALIPIGGLIGAVFGVSWFFSTIDGWDGFLLGALVAAVGMCIVPVLPICLIYEVCYIAYNKIPRLKKISSKKFAISVIALCAVVGVGALAYSFRYEVEAMAQKASAKQMLKHAEEKIVSNTSTVNVSGIFGIEECIYEMILVDYDKHQVGVLQSSLDEFQKFTLKKTTGDSDVIRNMKEEYYVQVAVPLSSPGSYLYSFYSDPENSHRTGCFLLEMEDGTCYYRMNIKDRGTDYESYLGLRNSEYYVGDCVRFRDLELN